MAKAKTPSFVITIEMQTNDYVIKAIEDSLEIARVIYNSCVGELLKREKQMKRTKEYRRMKRCLRAISQKLAYFEEKGEKEKIHFYKDEKDRVFKGLFSFQQAQGLTEYAMHEFANPIRKHFRSRLNANIAQKIATRAWNTFHKKLKGEAKRVNFIKRGEILSFEGKTNTTGWIYRNRHIVFDGKKIGLQINEKDVYIQESLSAIENEVEFRYKDKKGQFMTAPYKVKYVRIVKRVIRGKNRYFAQMTVQGFPPPKRNNDGSFKHVVGEGRVGGDLGTSSIAVVGENEVLLTNLADNVINVSNKIRLIQRKMDRSKRTMNPMYYHDDGTIKKGKKVWNDSKRYKRLKAMLKELHRKQAISRKLSHNQLTNQLLSFGDEHYWEDMNIHALQKRAKKTEISEKTGKYKRKKRFGKSIGYRAPAMFLRILEHKIVAHGGSFAKVNTFHFKASQYDHKSNECKKKELKERWHMFDDGTKVQRDLYSAFLLKNSNKTKTKTNRKLCEETFLSFKEHHDREIRRIEEQEFMVLNSGIRIRTKKAIEVA